MAKESIFRLTVLSGALIGAFMLGLVAARAQAPTEDTDTTDQVAIDFQNAPTFTLPDDYEKNFTVNVPPGLSGRIIFSVHIGDYDRIFELDLDGRKVRKIVEGPGNNNYPTFSPDGTKFAFVSDRSGKKQIYMANWDGSQQKELTSGLMGADTPTWTTNGKGVIFSREKSTDARGETDLAVVSASSGDVVPLMSMGGRNLTPRMSPNGSIIAYSTNRFWPGWDVCLWDIKEKKETCPLQGAESYCRPAWSPNGEEITYAFGADDIDIGMLSNKDGSKNSLTHLDLREYDPVFSPTGTHIAFVSESGHKDVFNLYVFDRELKKSIVVLKSTYSIRYPSWSAETTLKLQAEEMRESDQKQRSMPANPSEPVNETAAAAKEPVATAPGAVGSSPPKAASAN